MPGYFYSSRLFLKARNQVPQVVSFLLFVAPLFLCLVCRAQRNRINDLKRSLPSLPDSTRIDCLNALGLTYTYLQTDSATLYTRMANTEARAIHYKRGIAMALNNSAHIAGMALHNYFLQEKISRQAIQQSNRLNDKQVLAEAYMNLALALFCQGYFDRSVKVCIETLQLSQRTGDKKIMGEAIAMLGCISSESGNYENSFEYFNRSLELFKDIRDSFNIAIVLVKIGDLYRLSGDSAAGLGYYYQSLKYPTGPSDVWHPLIDLGDTYYSTGQYDPAMNRQDRYMQAIKSLTIRSNYATLAGIRHAETQIAGKEYGPALALLKKELQLSRERNDNNLVMRLLFDIAKAYELMQEYNTAFYYLKDLLQTAEQHGAKQYIRDGYKLTADLYDRLRNTDSAYAYYRKYTAMKDSVALDEFGKKLALYKAAVDTKKKQAQIELLSNERTINQQQLQLSKQQLKAQSFFKNILIIGVMVLILIGFILFRNIILKQKNEANRHEIVKKELTLQRMEMESTKAGLQQQATELEMQALRAQMNPHFIFNSLNSINRFILQNNRAQASEYLTKFSRLIRLILQNSQSPLITLESELEALRLYLELEAVRFNHHFYYQISVQPSVDVASLKVPPLIIQPYTENAVWHGLMHKEEKGHLQIDLFEQDEMLCCKITDDGIGRKKAAALKSKSASIHKSMGMQITAKRISMLQKERISDTEIVITDIVLPDGTGAGTEVLIKIPLCYD